MVTNVVSEVTKWRMCRAICDTHGYFIVDMTDRVLLYRRDSPRNTFVGKRKNISGMLALVKQTTGFK